MDKQQIKNIRIKCEKRMMEGVTDEMILKANSEIKKESCRPLKIIDKLEFQLEMCHVLIIKCGFVFGTIYCNSQTDAPNIDPPLLYEKGFSIVVTPLKETYIGRITEQEYITDSLWTCDCGTNYIRSAMCPQCDCCGQTIWKSEQRLKPISELLNIIKGDKNEL